LRSLFKDIVLLRCFTRLNDSTQGVLGNQDSSDTTSTIAQADSWSLAEGHHEFQKLPKFWNSKIQKWYVDTWPDSKFCFTGLKTCFENLEQYLPDAATRSWLKDSLEHLPLITETITDVRTRETAFLSNLDETGRNPAIIDFRKDFNEALPPLYPPEFDDEITNKFKIF